MRKTLDVERVITELGIDVKKSRGKEISAHCPFHDDRHPSFSINRETGAWICYSRCGGGGILELVARVLGLNNKDSRKWLADRGQPSGRAGDKVKQGKGKAAQTRAAPKKSAVNPCPPFDIKNLPTWILDRGFSAEILTKYQCGTSYFYDALVIPVLQSHALIYRRAPGREPKYKYTEDFKAHSTLYGLPDVEIGEDGSIILVEGPLDCLWLRQHGYHNSLAIMGGNTVGMAQRKIIKELEPKRVILAYDNDEAGELTRDKTVVALRKLECHAVQWEGVEWPDEDDDELTVVPSDVAEMPKDKLDALLANAALVPVEAAKARLDELKKKSTKGSETP